MVRKRGSRLNSKWKRRPSGHRNFAAPNIRLGRDRLATLLSQKANGVKPVFSGTGTASNLVISGTVIAGGMDVASKLSSKKTRSLKHSL